MDQSVRLTVFGSSAGLPTEKRLNTAIGLWRGEGLYLVDCGEPVAAHLARRGVHPDTLRAVFLTHMHSDHTGGLPMLLQWLQLNGRRRPLPLCLPAEAVDGVRDFLNLVYLLPDLLGFDLELRPVRPGMVYEEEGMTVEALANGHLAGAARQARAAGLSAEGQSFSYVVGVDGKRVYFSGDLAGPAEAVGPSRGVDLAVVELAHFTPEALGEALAAGGVGRLLVTHVIHTLEPVEGGIPERIKGAGFGGEISVAQDGDEFEV